MGARGQEILATVKQRIEALENELAVHLETRNQVGAQQLRQQIQELQTKYSGTAAGLHTTLIVPHGESRSRLIFSSHLCVVLILRVRNPDPHLREDP